MPLLAAVALLLPVGIAGPASPAAAAPSCATSNPGGPSYSVKVCLSVGTGSTVSGDATVTATVTITGTSPGLRKMEFTMDGGYLLTDFQTPYTFFIPTPRFVDGVHNVRATAQLRDGRSADSPAVSATFANGVTSPPPLATGFTPTSGRPAAEGEHFVVAATGDGASGQTTSDQVVDLVDSWQPNLFLYTGDVYEKGTETEFENWYGRDGVRFGKFKTVTNPIVGNHEYENGEAPGYFNYWSSVPDYYSYDAGGWHFIALNSNTQLDEFDPGSAQYEWLEADLAANPGGCTLAYFHHPVLSVGPQGDTPNMFPMWRLMADSGVDIVVTGHDHQYQRWTPMDRNFNPASDGIVHFVAGGGGHGIQSTVRTDYRVAAVADTTANGYGALRLELAGGSALYSYVSPGGAVQDSGSITCTGTTTDHEPPSVPAGLTAVSEDGPDVQLAWSASTDDRGVASYDIRRGTEIVATVPATERSWMDRETAPLTMYEYAVRATDLSDNHSAWSDPVPVTTADVKTSFTFLTSEDAYVSSAAPSTTLGTRAELRVDSTPVQIAYLRFQVQGLGTRVPSSVLLRVRAASNHSAGFEVRRVTGAWTEQGVTYANRPTPGALVASTGPIAVGTWVEVPVTGVVQGDGTLDLALTALSATGIKLDARESGSPAQLLVGFADTGNPLEAGPVQVTVAEDGSATWVPVISGGDGSLVTCAIESAAASGTATVLPDCSGGSYSPAPDFAGPDEFSYRVSDDAGSAIGVTSVAVTPMNDEPHAQAAAAETWEGTSTTVILTASDVDGDCPLAFETQPPTHGTLGAVGPASCSGGQASAPVMYTAGTGWTGTDSFAFTARDPSGEIGQGIAEVVVTSVPASLTVLAAADGFVDASNPTRNYGSRNDLRVDASPNQSTYVRFELGAYGAGATGLALRVNAGSTLAAGFEVHATDGGWVESTLTAQTAPAVGALLASSGPVQSGSWVEVPIPAAAVASDGSVNLVLTALSSTALRLNSRETATPPELVASTG